MSKTKDNFSHVIKYYKTLSEEDRIKGLDNLLRMKIINKTNYKGILKECQKKENITPHQ